MKKLTVLLFVLTMALSLQSAVFAENQYSLDTEKINGDTYIKLEDAQKIFNFSYKKGNNDSIIITDIQTDWVKKVAQNSNQSVVAIIGDSQKANTDALNDYYYSKIPAGLTYGSGAIISQDGRIITNNHVVDGMKEIYVVLSDKRSYKAELLYKNKDMDLALIKINAGILTPIQFEDMKNVAVGDEVIAIGTPLDFGWSNSVTKGIISGLNRPVDESYTYLQTDVSINPGNSGGPLINKNGRLVGINTLGIMYYQGINFAIPVENVQYFLDQYNKYGKIRRAYTGLEFEESWLALLGIPSDQGLKVIGMKEDCIVPEGKVNEGDILEAIDGKKITSIASYNEVLKGKLPGSEVLLTFSRNGAQYSLRAVLKEYPEQTNSKKQ